MRLFDELNVTVIQLSFFRIYKNHGKLSIVTLAARFNKNSRQYLLLLIKLYYSLQQSTHIIALFVLVKLRKLCIEFFTSIS